ATGSEGSWNCGSAPESESSEVSSPLKLEPL
ncbi:MAG: hypothetical protein K0S65_3443, partial [Labilithrix sp.]|nr:hypothetical protein [Labilithrix sp.]